MPPKNHPLRKSQSKRSSSSTLNEDTHEDKVEPYHCKGKFLEDFDALCRQAQITYIVPVVPRPRVSGALAGFTSAADTKDKAATKASKIASNKEREAAAHQHAELESGDTLAEEVQPKTYTLRDNLEYFKPKIQVEMDNPDKHDTLTEILIRAWKIDRTILDIFAQTFPTLERLHTLHFWHTGLTDETLKQLASILPKCANLRTLILDANPIPLEQYHVLFTDDSLPVVNLFLRHCRITERGAASIAQGLGTERRQNKKLQTLNLAYNSIGDAGAERIASSLKFNRTLLVLNLSSNDISDEGAQKLAEVLSKFPLTPDELVHRRRLLLYSSMSENPTTVSSARRQGGDMRTSSSSSPNGVARKKSGLSSTVGPSKSKATSSSTGGKADAKETSRTSKKDEKPSKKGSTIAESKTGKGAGGGAGGGKQSSDKLSKTLGNAKGSTSVAGNRSVIQTEPEPINHEGIPLLDQNAELINDELVLPGNKCLLSLNLSKNRISPIGVQHLLQAIQYQEMFIKLNISTKHGSSNSLSVAPSQGLLRLDLQRNDFAVGQCEIHEKLQAFLAKRREPLFKSRDHQDETSTGGRDTAGTPHAKSRAGTRH